MLPASPSLVTGGGLVSEDRAASSNGLLSNRRIGCGGCDAAQASRRMPRTHSRRYSTQIPMARLVAGGQFLGHTDNARA
jgi:hypothetical protein